MNRRTGIGVALLVLAAISGCAGSGPTLLRPDVVLTGIELQKLTFSEQTVLLNFDVGNHNPFPLPVRSVRYKVFLARQEFATGETPERFTVPANGESHFSISVELDLMNSAANLAPLLRASAGSPLDYELHGSLSVAIPLARPISFSRQGTIVVH